MVNFAAETINPLALPSLPLAHRKQLPDVSAVYFCLGADEELLYIGQTSSLYWRWGVRHHPKLVLCRKLGMKYLAWLVVEPCGNNISNRWQRLNIERELIRRFDPPLNMNTTTLFSKREAKYAEVRERIETKALSL